MEVNVVIDCSDRLEQLVEKTLDVIGAVKVKTIETKPRKKTEKKVVEKTEEKPEEIKPADVSAGTEHAGTEHGGAEPEAEPELVLEPETAEEPEKEVKKIIVPESAKEAPVMDPKDVRQAMLDTYERLEGQVKEELKDKVHEQAKQVFKDICKGFGVSKPSQLPDGASRWEFVNQLNGVHVDSEGCVTPF